MKDEVLFEIKQEHLETGLRGFPVGYCTTSTVDPQLGLFYAGKSVAEMKDQTPESVIFLLLNAREGSQQEVDALTQDLRARSGISKQTIEAIYQLPRTVHPMKLFSLVLVLYGSFQGKNDYREDCLNLIANLPELAAHVITYHAGWKMRPSHPEKGYMDNFTHMLHVPNVDQEGLKEVFRLFNILHFDHGGGNLSTFVGKAIASGMEDLFGSLAGAMFALDGPRHGRANQDCLEFTKEVHKELREGCSVKQVEDYIRRRLESNRLIFGFGHAVLRVEDPRATIFYTVAQERYAKHPLVELALKLRQAGPKVLMENPKISDPYPNVDAISGILLTAAGFAYPEYYTLLFGLSRCVGIGIQIVYERCYARGGRGTPIVRPKYIYKQPEMI